jgi:hypothetical protein
VAAGGDANSSPGSGPSSALGSADVTEEGCTSMRPASKTADEDGAAGVSDEHPGTVSAVTATLTIAPSRAQGVIARL